MKPLQSIAMGLLIVALSVRVNGEYDVLPDPVGWLLVLQGLGQLPGTLPHRPPLRTLGFLALVLSIVLWFPVLATGLEDADVALLWAASLPQLAFIGLLCRGLAALADDGAVRWLHTAFALTIAAAVLVTVVLATEESALEDALALVGSGVLILVIVLLFRYSSRPWAHAPLDQTTAAGPAPGS